jgi:hypothetical protein
MKRLAAKVLLFTLPFAIVLGAPAYVLLSSGEFTSVEKVIRMQSTTTTPVLFGRAYSDPTARYKLQSVVSRKPEVLVLGTSRVMALRGDFFRDGVQFFNAGNGITRLGHLRPFLARVPPRSTPKIIVLGVDQYFLNANFDSLAADDMTRQWDADVGADAIFFSSWTKIYGDFRQGKFTLQHLAQPAAQRRIGLNAVVHANAFRNDGSYLWGEYVRDPDNPNNGDYQFHGTFDRIANGYRRFEYAAHVADANLAELQRFLADCSKRGIHVVGFLPPFAHVVYQKMRSMPVEYGYLAEIPARVQPVFAQYGYRLFDFSDLADLGASDRETIDGFHGSEKAYLRLFVRMAQGDPVLGEVARPPTELHARIDGTAGDQLVFGL